MAPWMHELAPLDPAREEALERQLGLVRLRRYARLLDTSIRIPFTKWRMGVDSLVGFVPVVGDKVGLVLSSWVLVVAAWHGVTLPTFLKMLWNVLFEFAVGSVPLFGDVFDVWYRASTRNVKLLEREWGAVEVRTD